MSDIPLTAFGEVSTADVTMYAGWTFAYNINPDMVTVSTSGGTVTQSNDMAHLSTGAAQNQWAKIESRLPLRYITGFGGLARFTAIFTPPAAGSVQMIGIGDANDGFFFGYNGTTFGVLRRRGGSDGWVAKNDWKFNLKHSLESRLDTTKGNVFQIKYQWLGYGGIRFFIEEPSTAEFTPVHLIEYANANTVPSISNPTLPLMAYVANTTNDTDIVLATASGMAALEGKPHGLSAPHPFVFYRPFSSEKTGITTETNVLTVKNLATYQSKTNRVRSMPTLLNVATDGTKIVTVRGVKNTTLGGTPSYADYDLDRSPLQSDTAGTTLTGGTEMFSLKLGKVDSKVIDLEKIGVVLDPGETLTISAASSVAADVSVSLTMADLF